MITDLGGETLHCPLFLGPPYCLCGHTPDAIHAVSALSFYKSLKSVKVVTSCYVDLQKYFRPLLTEITVFIDVEPPPRADDSMVIVSRGVGTNTLLVWIT